MTDRKLLAQALEALSRSDYLGWQSNIPIITALRDRLAQPEQEPVAWADMDVRGEDKGLSWTPGHFHKTPLYTTPPQRKPLTFEQVEDCFPEGAIFSEDDGWLRVSAQTLHDIVRNVEAAHGIKGEA